MFDPDYDLFLSIVAAGSISAAARERGLSTAALSKRLVRLEERLCVRLINRTTRRLALTPAGRDLHEALLPLRSTLQAAEELSAIRPDLDGQQVSYAHGPIQPTHFDWPGPNGSRLVRLTFVPVGGGTPAIVTKEGPWAWFRLLHEATLTPQGQPDRYRVALAVGPRSAAFDLLADSVDNPFSLELFQQFRCPGGDRKSVV